MCQTVIGYFTNTLCTSHMAWWDMTECVDCWWWGWRLLLHGCYCHKGYILMQQMIGNEEIAMHQSASAMWADSAILKVQW